MADMNAFSLGPQPGGPAPEAPSLSGDPREGSFMHHIDQTYAQSKAAHGKMMQANSKLEVVRRELDSLLDLGDMIQPEDVIKGAGALVGSGFDPQQMAQMLATMPMSGGQALQAWVQQQDQQIVGMEKQMAKAMAQQTQHLGIAAMTKLQALHHRARLGGDHDMPAGPPMGGALGGPLNA